MAAVSTRWEMVKVVSLLVTKPFGQSNGQPNDNSNHDH